MSDDSNLPRTERTDNGESRAPEWATARSAPLTGMDATRAGLYHWERATVMFVRDGIPARVWPAPGEYDRLGHPVGFASWLGHTGAYPMGLLPVSEDRRRELVREFLGLRCQTHFYFDAAEMNRVIEGYSDRTPRVRREPNAYLLGDRPAPFAPRKRATAEASYIFAEDAAALLLHESVPPSGWPDVYVGHRCEPQRAADKWQWIRWLFCGDELRTPAFMLEYQVQSAVRGHRERFNAMCREVFDRFGPAPHLLRDHLASRTISAPQAAQSSDAGQQPQAKVRPARQPWWGDAVEALRELGENAQGKELYEALARREGYRDSLGCLHLPKGGTLKVKTLQNKLSELKAEAFPK